MTLYLLKMHLQTFLSVPITQKCQILSFEILVANDTIYLTAVGLTPGDSSTVHIYTQTIQRTTQHKKIHRTTQKLARVRAVPRLCGFYPGICLTTEEKARKNISQGSHT